MKATATVSVTALDRATTVMFCSRCGPVQTMLVPFDARRDIEASVTKHMRTHDTEETQ